MPKDIVGKLDEFLRLPIDDEPRVVYLLAQVRKLLERDDPTHSKRALWMYCHWAVHVDLSATKTTMEFLKRIDYWVTNTIAYLKPSGPWDARDEYYLFKDFLFLTTFRQELLELLKSYDLPTNVCDVDEQWYGFLEAYSGVIEDGTLSLTAKQNSLAAVSQVTFAKGQNLTLDHHVPFVIQWKIALKDGRTVKTSVETVPNAGGNMTSHLVEVVNGQFIPPRTNP